MTQEKKTTNEQPLPSDPAEFYRAGGDAGALQPTPAGAPSALERLGPSPFPKGKFPFLGFLASVYDHVSTHAKSRVKMEGKTPQTPPSTGA